jgi:hypothetical protein
MVCCTAREQGRDRANDKIIEMPKGSIRPRGTSGSKFSDHHISLGTFANPHKLTLEDTAHCQ